MPVNRQTVRELSRTTLYNITSSGQAWRAFLDAAARLYKYSFPEQVLIYAQEPEATACAAKEVYISFWPTLSKSYSRLMLMAGISTQWPFSQ